jgi:hypothetical protein
MKRGILLFFLLIICCTGLIFYSKSNKKDEKWDNPEAWKKLAKGMTTKQVEELLGKPGQIIRASSWYYQDLPREIHKEPSYGYVRFKPENSSSASEEWVVYEWAEPNWAGVKKASDQMGL